MTTLEGQLHLRYDKRRRRRSKGRQGLLWGPRGAVGGGRGSFRRVQKLWIDHNSLADDATRQTSVKTQEKTQNIEELQLV